jgi:hypothetical protein
MVLVIAGVLAGALLAEVSYRLYLNYKSPGRFDQADRDKNFAAFNVSHWEFDEKFGYLYPPGRVIDLTRVGDGRVYSCERIATINKFGNIGPVSGDWHTAAVKIAVFGDSFTAYVQDGIVWPNALQKVLEDQLKRPVAVMNFGRDGYGLLQMFDLAAGKIPEWKPDIVVIAFITDDLARARFWRSVIGERDEQRVLTTVDPVPKPQEDRAADTFLLMASATNAWCKSIVGTARTDDTLNRMIEKHRRLRQRIEGLTPKLWDFSYSYLFNRLWHGNQFWFFDNQPLARSPRHAYSTYAEDSRFMENARQLRALGSKIVLFHLAYYPEIKANTEYLANRQQKALLGSLELTTGIKILRTTDYISLPVEQPERMSQSAADLHPSVWGMEFYATAVARALLQERVLEQRTR